jgi:tRNA dimethylallyltransferase
MRVISCDSRQFFQEMTIGTAVPTQRNCRCTSFYSVQIYFNYSVGDFEKEAIAKIDELFFWPMIMLSLLVPDSINAVLKGFDEFPEIDSTVRERYWQLWKLSCLFTRTIKNTRSWLFRRNHGSRKLCRTRNEWCVLQNVHRFRKTLLFFPQPEKNSRNFTPILIGLEAEKRHVIESITLHHMMKPWKQRNYHL